jgi:hypothetical protein
MSGDLLAKAIEKNDLANVKFILARSKDIDFHYEHLIKCPLGHGNTQGTIMTLACKYGNKQIVQALIKAWAPIGLQGELKRLCPLHEAACYGRLDIIDILVDAKAGLEELDHFGNTPLASIFFSYVGQTDIKKVMDKLLARGAKINPSSGNTPLNNFISYNKKPNIALLEHLIKCGADVNLSSSYRHSPLISALVHKCSTEVILYLLKHGADYTKRGTSGWVKNKTALDVVKEQSQLPIEEMYFVDGDEKVNMQERPKLLIEMKRSITQQTKEGIFELYRGNRQNISILSSLPIQITDIISEYIICDNPELAPSTALPRRFIDRIKLPKSYVERVNNSRQQTESKKSFSPVV